MQNRVHNAVYRAYHTLERLCSAVLQLLHSQHRANVDPLPMLSLLTQLVYAYLPSSHPTSQKPGMEKQNQQSSRSKRRVVHLHWKCCQRMVTCYEAQL